MVDGDRGISGSGERKRSKLPFQNTQDQTKASGMRTIAKKKGRIISRSSGQGRDGAVMKRGSGEAGKKKSKDNGGIQASPRVFLSSSLFRIIRGSGGLLGAKWENTEPGFGWGFLPYPSGQSQTPLILHQVLRLLYGQSQG